MNLYQGLLFLHGFRIDPAHVDDAIPHAAAGRPAPATVRDEPRPTTTGAPAPLRGDVLSAAAARSVGRCG